MDKQAAEVFMNMLLAMNGQGLPNYVGSDGGSIYDYNRSAGLMRQPDSLFGPIGSAVAGFIPGLTTVGIDGNPTPVFRTNLTAQPSGMTGFQNLYMRQNAKAYGAIRRSHSEQLREQAAALSKTLNGGQFEGLPGRDALVSALRSDIGGSMMQNAVNGLIGYDMGASVAVANQRSPYMAAAYLNRQHMSNQMLDPAVLASQNAFSDNTMHPAGSTDPTVSMIERPNYGATTRNTIDLYNPFSDEAAEARRVTGVTAQKTADKLTWDGYVKRGGVHGASNAYVTEIVSNAIAASQRGDLNLGDDATAANLDISRSLEDQKNKQRELNNIYTRKGDSLQHTAGIDQLQKELAAAKESGNKDEASYLEGEIKRVIEEEVKPAEEALDKIAESVANGMKPFVEAVTGATASLKDFYGSEEAAKRALNDLTGGKASTDKEAANRLRDQITEVKALGGMAGLSPEVTGRLFQMSVDIAKTSGGSKLGALGGTGAQASVWTGDLLRGLIGSGVDPSKADAYVKAHAEGQAAWNKSRNKKGLVALEYAKKNGLFDGNDDPDYAELQSLMTSGSKEDMDEAMRRLGQKLGFSSAEFKKFISNDQNIGEMEMNLSEEEKENVNRAGVKSRANEMRLLTGKAAYTVEQRRERGRLKEAGVSASDIAKAEGASDFDAMIAYLEENNPEAAKALKAEYAAAMEKAGDPQKAKRMANDAFRRSGGLDMLSPEDQKEMENQVNQRRTNTLRRLNNFEGRANGVISAEKGGFYESVGAVGSKGMNKTAMLESTKDMTSQLRKMSGASRKDGSRLSSKDISNFEKEYNDLMKSGKFEEARDLSEKFFSDLDETTQNRVKATAKKKRYSTNENIDAQERARNAVNGVLVHEEVAKSTKGVSADGSRLIQSLYKNLAEEADPKKRAQIIKEIKQQENEAEKESRSDAEKAIKAFQEGNWNDLVAILKSNNVELDEFIDRLRKLGGFLGGVSVKESATAASSAADKKGIGSPESAAFLSRPVSDAERMSIAKSRKDSEAYLSALNGGKVGNREVERWMSRVKNSKIDKESMAKSIDIERKLVLKNKEKIDKQIEEQRKISGGKSVQDLEKEISEEQDPEKKKKLEEKLGAAKKADSLSTASGAATMAEQRLKKSAEIVRKMTKEEYAAYVKKLREGKTGYPGTSEQQGPAGSGSVSLSDDNGQGANPPYARPGEYPVTVPSGYPGDLAPSQQSGGDAEGGSGGGGTGAESEELGQLLDRLDTLCRLLELYVPRRSFLGY